MYVCLCMYILSMLYISIYDSEALIFKLRLKMQT